MKLRRPLCLAALTFLATAHAADPHHKPAVPSKPAGPGAGHDHPPPQAPPAGRDPHVDHAAHAAAPGENPVKAEMASLNAAILVSVTAIANNTLEQIPPALHGVHAAKAHTEKALQQGTYQPPVNGDKLKQFIAEDQAFHNQLVKLLKAAEAKDLKGATRQMGAVLQGCTQCHVKFRFPPAVK